MNRKQQKAIHQYAARFRKGMLGKQPSDGWCYCLCTALQGALSFEFQQDTELLLLDFPRTNHVVLRLEENLILDPTADQFPETRQAGVYLGPMLHVYRRWMEEYHESRKAA